MIKILFSAGGYPIKQSLVLKVVKVSARLENKIKGEVEINVVDDKTIKKLNKSFRQQDRVTDVLSFAWREDKTWRGPALGQIFICYPQIKRQSQEYQVSIKAEFVRMLVHGLLHLVGYDHGRSQETRRMLGLQEKIIKEAQ